ncbi:MAG: hypothetical protein NZ846_06505 [Thermus sp.]|uniref:hypothetical protein n=1 Tax=Thermus sp. TaxID=275 RepID=UPI0025E1C580|nr:hypothetical protein [Thermus sp.]MCS6868018.1 hypothetical protein [Thermus sp.]MCS7218613.1 hypothetical protein [Thermus sp.]MDW8016895.1 hypothetical protein [Thermus sp.]MDW8357110.1 hypothetical protein [Thermus sp.]
MRLKRFSGRVRRVVKGTGQQATEKLWQLAEDLRGEDPKAPRFRERLLTLAQLAKERWENLSPEERQRLFHLLKGLVLLLPLGRLGPLGSLLKRAASLGDPDLLALLLRLKR